MVDIILFIAVIVVAVMAEQYRKQRDFFADEVLKQYQWIDDIIEALETEDEEAAQI